MKILLQLLLTLSFLITNLLIQQSPIPYQLNAPKDWRHETINFPLDFAPEIKFKGFEELRFSPGMFKPDSNSYFSYAFFWYLEGNEKITPEILENSLNLYFRGLCDAVGKSRGLKIDLNAIKTKVELIETTPANKYKSTYHASIDTYDPFNKGEKISLNSEIVLLNTASKNSTVLFFTVSPKPFNNEIWKELFEIRDSLVIK